MAKNMEDEDGSPTAPAQMKSERGQEFTVKYQAWGPPKALCGFLCGRFSFMNSSGVWPQEEQGKTSKTECKPLHF